LRSRLPGYPGLRVPQIAAQATRVAGDGFWDSDFPWLQSAREQRFQLQGPPPLERALELPDNDHEAYDALADLLDALKSCPPWREFAAVRASLSDAESEELRERLRAFRAALAPDRVAHIAGTNASRIRELRFAELAAVKRSASAGVSAYYRAFETVDEIISTVAVILNIRLAGREIAEIRLLAADWGPPAPLRRVRVVATDVGPFIQPLEALALRTSIPTVSGVVVAHNISYRVDPFEVVTVEGRLLEDSSFIPSVAP
jgi:hypothetical protein